MTACAERHIPPGASPLANPADLTNLVSWSQRLACEALQPGDTAVDLTAGRGRDTLALAQAAAPSGRVLAFDLQSVALDQTERLLQQHGFRAQRLDSSTSVPKGPGHFLVNACHSELLHFVSSPVRVIMANLGYLPGGDHALTTRSATTLAALAQAVPLLQPGGRLVITVYPGHPGGNEEAVAVGQFCASLPRADWEVLELRVSNSSGAPRLVVAEQRSGAPLTR
jgi:predicted methyltransferase